MVYGFYAEMSCSLAAALTVLTSHSLPTGNQGLGVGRGSNDTLHAASCNASRMQTGQCACCAPCCVQIRSQHCRQAWEAFAHHRWMFADPQWMFANPQRMFAVHQWTFADTSECLQIIWMSSDMFTFTDD